MKRSVTRRELLSLIALAGAGSGVELEHFINENKEVYIQDDEVMGGKPLRNREFTTHLRGFMAELIAKNFSKAEMNAPFNRTEAEALLGAVRGPSLAGLEPWYLTRQLRAFRAGHRGNQSDDTPAYEMQHSVDELSDDEIETVAAEIAAWPVKPPEPTITGNLENGARHYIQCAVCHGPRAEGNAALGAPALTGRNDWYLFRQIKLFQSGARGTHRDDPWGRLMLAPARILKTDQQINDVLAYINQL